MDINLLFAFKCYRRHFFKKSNKYSLLFELNVYGKDFNNHKSTLGSEIC